MNVVLFGFALIRFSVCGLRPQPLRWINLICLVVLFLDLSGVTSAGVTSAGVTSAGVTSDLKRLDGA